MAIIEAAVQYMRNRQEEQMEGFAIERFDAMAREICRHFAEGNRVGVVTELAKAANPTEAALLIAIATQYMPTGVHKSLIDFLTLQAMSLVQASDKAGS